MPIPTAYKEYLATVYDEHGNRRCAKCAEYKPIAAYRMKRGKPYSQCRKCNQPARTLTARRRMARKNGIVLDETDQHCIICDQTLNIRHFARRVGLNTYYPWCLKCQQRPDALEIAREYITRHDELDLIIAEALLRPAESGSFNRGLFFTLDPYDIIPLPLTCPVLGIPLDYDNRLWYAGLKSGERPKPDRRHIPSLDRIDSNGHYTPDNVLVVSFRVNTLKSNASVDEMRQMADFYGVVVLTDNGD